MSRDLMKRLLLRFLSLAQYDAWLLRSLKRDPTSLTVLALHQVSPEPNPFYPSLSPENFEYLLQFLIQEFEILSFQNLQNYKTEKPKVILTFDDGTYDFIEYAMPLLEKYKIRANQNIIVESVETGVPPWNLLMYDFLKEAPFEFLKKIRWSDFSLSDFSFSNPNARARFGARLSRYLKNKNRSERLERWQLIESLMEQLPPFKLTRMIGKKDLEEVAFKHDIGLHSYSHESMEFQSDDFFEEDFKRGNDFFKYNLGRGASVYAFPNGSHRPSQIEFLLRAGMQQILLVDEKVSRIDRHIHPRISFYAENYREAKLTALGYRKKGIERLETAPLR